MPTTRLILLLNYIIARSFACDINVPSIALDCTRIAFERASRHARLSSSLSFPRSLDRRPWHPDLNQPREQELAQEVEESTLHSTRRPLNNITNCTARVHWAKL